MDFDKEVVAFEQQLPRRLRRRWNAKLWGAPAIPGSQLEQAATTVKVYLQLIEFALNNNLKFITAMPEQQHNPYATLLWNLACFDRFRFADLETALQPTSKNSNRQIVQWLQAMYLRYPLPAWGYQALSEAGNTISAIDFIFRWGNGVSPRTILPLSKKESALLQTENIPFTKFPLVLAYCAALAANCSPPLAGELALVLHLTFPNIHLEKVLNFSRMLAPWAAVQPDLRPGNLLELCTFWQLTGLFWEANPLSGRTLKSVKRAMGKWYDDHSDAQERWSKHGLDLYLENNLVEFREINTVRGLQEEGHAQHNCVASYAKQCLAGKRAIVSMYAMKEDVRVTMEINLETSRIVQMKAVCNSPVPSWSRQYVRKFASDKKLELAA